MQISNGDLVTATFGKEEEAEIDHPGASRHRGQIWVSLSDMQPGVYAGERVQFHLYTERKGLGGRRLERGSEGMQRNTAEKYWVDHNLYSYTYTIVSPTKTHTGSWRAAHA